MRQKTTSLEGIFYILFVCTRFSIKEAEQFSSSVFSSCFLVIHDPTGSCEHKESKKYNTHTSLVGASMQAFEQTLINLKVLRHTKLPLNKKKLIEIARVGKWKHSSDPNQLCQHFYERYQTPAVVPSHLPKLSRRQQVTGPLLHVLDSQVIPWTDYSTLKGKITVNHLEFNSTVLSK